MASQDQESQERDTEMYAMACSGMFTDVEFAVGGQVFSAHRVMVCAGSPFFKKLLTLSFSETQSKGPIAIKDVSSGTFQLVHAFLYKRAVALQGQVDIGELLHVANRFCMDGLVKECIEAAKNGHINASNCMPLLHIACDLGEHGRRAPWSSLFEACTKYAAEHLCEVLDVAQDQAMPRHAVAGICSIIEKAVVSLIEEPLLLLKLWRYVRAWGKAAYDLGDLKAFTDWMMSLSYEAADFLDGSDCALELTGLDSAGTDRRDVSVPFRAGSFWFKLLVDRQNFDGKDWYCVRLLRHHLGDQWTCWSCYALWQFRWLHSSGSPEKDKASTMQHFFAAQSGWGRKLLEVAEAHSPGAGYIDGGRATVRATVKVNLLVALCTAAAFLDDSASPGSFLGAIRDVPMLGYVLAADSLPVQSEGALLDALADFADSGESEEHAEKVAALVPALRLDDVDFEELITTVRASPGLRTCEKLLEMLQAYLERVLAKPRAGRGRRAPLRGAVWRALQGPAAAGAIPERPQPPCVRTLVRCLVSPLAGAQEPRQPRHASRVQRQATPSQQPRSRSPRLGRGQRGGEAAAA